MFKHACKLGLEGIVSKRKDSTYRSGRSPDWLKSKNPACEAVRREAEEDLLPTCERLGIGFLPYFPLASGLLTGKYRRGQAPPEGTRLTRRDEVFTDETFDRLEALERYAEERGVTLLQVAIGGLLAQPAVRSVIAGATKPEQVRANVEAAGWEPAERDLAELNALR